LESIIQKNFTDQQQQIEEERTVRAAEDVEVLRRLGERIDAGEQPIDVKIVESCSKQTQDLISDLRRQVNAIEQRITPEGEVPDDVPDEIEYGIDIQDIVSRLDYLLAQLRRQKGE